MHREIRTAIYDNDLHLEAFHFQGIAQPFPNHFHDYYVFGLMEKGKRRLICQNQDYLVSEGCLLIFNPGDSHACSQTEESTLDYRGLNISKEVMSNLAFEITGQRILPVFYPSVITDQEIACLLDRLHEQIFEDSDTLLKEETLILLLTRLIEQYARPETGPETDRHKEIETACAFMEKHYAKRLTLDDICRAAGLSKSTLLRAFTRTRGITPYSCLETIRIQKARDLLEQGVSVSETAMRTGFCDQSHLTNSFSRLIGLTPGVYRDLFHQGKDKRNE